MPLPKSSTTDKSGSRPLTEFLTLQYLSLYITDPHTAMAERLVDSHKYNLWKKKLESNGLDVHRVDELYTRRNGHGDVLFSLLYTDATTPEGNKIPPLCFLKGEVVSVLICFIDSATREKYLLL